MMGYNNQGARKLSAPREKTTLESVFNSKHPDPLVDMEYVSPVDQGRFSMIGRLENGVSLLQSAQQNLDRIKFWLNEIKHFLEDHENPKQGSVIPKSVANQFMDDRLRLIKEVVETSSFQNRKLLNGDCGVKARVKGQNLRFVRGSARSKSSQQEGYAVAVYQAPKPSVLLGSGVMTSEWLEKETQISFADENQEVRYVLKDHETPDSLVKGLQSCFDEQHFDIGVYRTKDNRLFFRHNQLGSRAGFHGMSYKSPIISEKPGQYCSSSPGIDIAGTIAGESAHGDGGFLIGDRDNRNTDGLVVYYDGEVDFPGQVVGTVFPEQNGLMIPLDTSESKVERLSIPSIDPGLLSLGVGNKSGFEDLESIRATTRDERTDALKLVLWSIIHLNYLSDELRTREESYTHRTIELLKGDIKPLSAGDDAIYLSKDKAGEMVDQLKVLLSGN